MQSASVTVILSIMIIVTKINGRHHYRTNISQHRDGLDIASSQTQFEYLTSDRKMAQLWLLHKTEQAQLYFDLLIRPRRKTHSKYEIPSWTNFMSI